MRRIPLFAGRCPHCLDEDQGVHGRIFIMLLVLAALVVAAFYGSAYLERRKSDRLMEDVGRRLQDPEVRRMLNDDNLAREN
jgi:hypothetical protein